MAWKEFVTKRATRKDSPRCKDNISLYVAPFKDGKPDHWYVFLGANVIRDMKWRKGDYITWLIDEDSGLLGMRRSAGSEKGFVLQVKGENASARISIPKDLCMFIHTSFGIDMMPGTRVLNYRIDRDLIVIDCSAIKRESDK